MPQSPIAADAEHVDAGITGDQGWRAPGERALVPRGAGDRSGLDTDAVRAGDRDRLVDERDRIQLVGRGLGNAKRGPWLPDGAVELCAGNVTGSGGDKDEDAVVDADGGRCRRC
ncbi:MAG: hypothetical protein ACM3ML_36720 [Micromonosporaceae bacterium]